MGAPQLLAVDGYDLTANQGADRPHQLTKQLCNCAASSALNTRQKVSCDVIPFGNDSKLLNQATLLRPNSATASQSLAPQMIAQMSMTKMSNSACAFVREPRSSRQSAP